MRPRLYLAGPIGGESYSAATDWRVATTSVLDGVIDCFSPMRGFTHLKGEQSISDTVSLRAPRVHTTKGVISRDHNDVLRADCLLVRLHGAKKISTGTAIELAWAYHLHKPAVVWIEDGDENIHAQHPMLVETFRWRTPSISEAIEIVRGVLLP
jgi:nucleoside 2-deoxyribosyltransferase